MTLVKMGNVIEFDSVWKSYRRKPSNIGYLKDMISSFFHYSPNNSYGKGDNDPDRFWALREINFGVKKGEALGIIGPNGAGKTTILMMLAGIIAATKGKISINGRIAPLISLGAGFHPELTGRENIYLNGAILGLSREEIRQKFDFIVDFAKISKFLDMPVKRYSSGMFVRLGFSIAIASEMEIVLIDEVLSVGDLKFQKKSYDKIIDIKKSGKTVVLVSHNINAILAISDRVMWIDRGKMLGLGDPQQTIIDYSSNIEKTDKDETDVNKIKKHTRTKFRVKVNGRENKSHIFWGEKLTVDYIIGDIGYNISEITLLTAFHNVDGIKILSLSNCLSSDVNPTNSDFKQGITSCEVESFTLIPGTYKLISWISDKGDVRKVIEQEIITFLQVEINKEKWKGRTIVTSEAGYYLPSDVKWSLKVDSK